MKKESDECLVAEAPKDVTETENVDKFCPDNKFYEFETEWKEKLKLKDDTEKKVKNEPKF